MKYALHINHPVKSGDCDLCGRYSSKLISGVCVPCRLKFKQK